MYSYLQLSPAEWFNRNRQIAGFGNPTRALYQTVRELVENSLDATEPYGILPNIRVSIQIVDKQRSHVSVYVEDNGIGIPSDEIPNVFGRIFYSSKYRVKQHRGVFGLGLKMVVLYAQNTTGRPVWVRSATVGSDKIHEYEISIDVARNEPRVISHRVYENRFRWHGTAVKVWVEGDWGRARQRIEEYFRRLAMVTPYADMVIKTPDGVIRYERRTTKMPPKPEEGDPHPKGVDIDTVRIMIASTLSNGGDQTLAEFLSRNFDGVGDVTARRFLEWLGMNPETRISQLSDEDVKRLVDGMKRYEGWRRPSPVSLSPIGEELLELGAKAVLGASFVAAVTRKPSSYSGHPFVVEVAVAWGGAIPPSDQPQIYRFANKIPLLYDEGSDVMTKVVREFNWENYRVKFPAPLAVIVHIASTKVPFASAGKEAVAEVDEIEEEIRAALRDAAKKLRTYLGRVEREKELFARYVAIAKYIDEVADAVATVLGVDRNRLINGLKSLLEGKLGVKAEEFRKLIQRPPTPEEIRELEEKVLGVRRRMPRTYEEGEEEE